MTDFGSREGMEIAGAMLVLGIEINRGASVMTAQQPREVGRHPIVAAQSPAGAVPAADAGAGRCSGEAPAHRPAASHGRRGPPPALAAPTPDHERTHDR